MASQMTVMKKFSHKNRDHGRSAATRMRRALASHRAPSIPRALRREAEKILAENYAFMDSQMFRRKGLEAELFTWETHEPALPMTSWYQPTREEVADVNTHALTDTLANIVL